MDRIIQPRVLKGFRDFLPEAELLRKHIQAILEKTFRSYGFVPIDTPVLEYSEVLLGKGGGETDKQVYTFSDHGNRNVAMRFDLTVPLARFMAEHFNELYLPFKRYHISKVWRGENTQQGRYREFTQCDFDIVGVDCFSADFEILHLMYKCFRSLSLPRFSIRLSHRNVFNCFLQQLGAEDKSQEILRTVDKISKIGEKAVREALEAITNGKIASSILDFIKPCDNFPDTLAKMKESVGGGCEGTERLEEIEGLINETELHDIYYLDPSITRGLDYYTGIVFETYLEDVPEIGSICSGGRYNDLASLYTREKLPGVGSSIGLDRLIAAMEKVGSMTSGERATDIIIFCMEVKFMGYYHKIADTIRNAGLSCEVYPFKRKLKSQFNFAEKKKIPFALICGEEERERGTVTIKDLKERKSYENLDLKGAIEKVISLLKHQN
ncbi:MAG: histidine--tRNA ligase [Spirochaetes bacterium]|nr:MAG: histidine--tRNA ligase [Spirochaetota bacterium]